jgi:hypothetical protein
MSDLAAIVAGREGREVNLPSASDLTVNVNMIVPSTGLPHDLSTATLDAVIYDRGDRKNTTPITTIAVTIGTAANGKCTLVFTAANSIITPGRYYMFFRRTLAGDVRFARKFTILNVT